MAKHTRLSPLFRTASDEKLAGGAWEHSWVIKEGGGGGGGKEEGNDKEGVEEKREGTSCPTITPLTKPHTCHFLTSDLSLSVVMVMPWKLVNTCLP